jgi:small subunit ribosomal protein S17
MDKTITVAVESKSRHPLYNKLINSIKKVSVHDEDNIAKTGDVVKIMGTRPTSKTKRFRLVEIVKEHIEI